ncbi:DUF2884 family protein [Paraferrimonas sedimenticola]|uniref:DUF2884 family protein n=1 Tax=Paraferrimonas sedimenticola TaxID=375674 RepID=A0AA37S0E8_9GAMM|nr:DUF2884 family protein [Paraferrimonas sedimenticola]GLP98103.1 hypothetical protein GCM10007895_34100 [Paraferrimonas sedimenticola]
MLKQFKQWKVGLVLGLASLAPSLSAQAEVQCDLNIDQNFSIEGDKLTLGDKDASQMVLTPQGVFKDNKPVDLSAEAKAQAEKYRQMLVGKTPEIVDLVQQALKITETTLSELITPLLNEKNQQGLETLVNNMRERVSKMAGEDNRGYYFIGSDKAIDNFIDEETEAEMRDLLQSVAGQFMAEVGAQMMNGGDGAEALQQKMAQLQNLGTDLEARLKEQSEQLERQANKLCEDLKKVEPVEEKLNALMPELGNLRLFKPSDKGA